MSSTLLQKKGRPLVQRFSLTRVKRFLWAFFRYALLIGIGFIIVYPFLAKISSMFMSMDDIRDPIVWFIPRRPTLYNVRIVLEYGQYWTSLLNTFVISLLCAVLQMISCTWIGYGLARFQFRGRGLVYALMIFTIVIPPQTLMTSLYEKFRFFDVWGIGRAFGLPLPNLVEKLTPMVILSITGFGLKNGLYMLVLTQCFRSVPRELSEAAYVDGAGPFTTFLRVIMPQAKAIMISVFMLAFSWQWTDTFYSQLFFRNTPVLPNILAKVTNIQTLSIGTGANVSATMANTAIILLILPLFLFYLVGQRFLIQGVERSGLVG